MFKAHLENLMTFPGIEEPALCMPDKCFCEIIHEGTIKQPMNTYSSLVFILFAIFILIKFIKRKDTTFDYPLYASISYPIIYFLSLILIGLGSMYYHSALNFWGQFADVSGMNLLASFILIYHLKRKKIISNFTLSFVLINLVLAYFLFAYPFLRRYLFGIVLFLSLIPLYIPSLKAKFIFKLKYREPSLPQGFLLNNQDRDIETATLSSSNTNYKFFWIALSTQIIAFIFWTLDITKIVCDENSFLQGHSIWHILSGVASYYLYLFYESEKINLNNYTL